MPDETPAAAKTGATASRNWSTERRALTVFGFMLFVLILGYVLLVQHYLPSEAMQSQDVALILAPLLAAAAAIERTLETVFDLIETRSRKVVAFFAGTEAWIEAAEHEVVSSRTKLIQATANLNEELAKAVEAQAEAKEKQLQGTLIVLQHRVDRAEKLLSGVTVESPDYRQAKRLATLYLSLLFGLLIASFGSVQMLHLLGILHGGSPALAALDVLLTGVVMATGSGPVHSIINLLQQGKEALQSASQFLNARKTSPAPPEAKPE
jgi:hypothetical protein